MRPVPKITTIKLNSITAATKWKHMGSRSKAIFDQLNEKGFYDNYNLHTAYKGLKRFTGTKIHLKPDNDNAAQYVQSKKELQDFIDKNNMPFTVPKETPEVGRIEINTHKLREAYGKDQRKHALLHEQLESLFFKKRQTTNAPLVKRMGHISSAVLHQENRIPKLMGYGHKSDLLKQIKDSRSNKAFEVKNDDNTITVAMGTERGLHRKYGRQLNNLNGNVIKNGEKIQKLLDDSNIRKYL